MIRETIAPVLEKVGILQPAMEDALARAERCFGDGSPTDTELIAWAERLRTEAPHLFCAPGSHSQVPSLHTQIPDWLSPSEKLARARKLGLTVPGKVKPAPPLTLSAAQHAELAQLGPVARLQRYRQWQAEAQTGQR